MTTSDKLTVEAVKKLADTCQDWVSNEDFTVVAKQLLDTMRENERLKADVAMFACIAEEWKEWCFKRGFEGLPDKDSDIATKTS